MPDIFKIHYNLQRIISEGGAEGIGRIVLYGSEIQDKIVSLQKEQLLSGKDSTGEDIAPSYRSVAYADFKQGMNSRPEYRTPDLKLTGAFYSGIYFNTDLMNPTSSDPKTPSLEEKYGNSGKNPVLGLNNESLKDLHPVFNEKFGNEFLAQLKEE